MAKVMATGHRPNKLGGYDPSNPLRKRLRAKTREHLLSLEPELAITGVALGFDQDFAQVCIALKIPFLAAVPFLGQEHNWPTSSQKAYHELLAKADKVIYVSPPGYDPRKLLARNIWMVEEIGDDGSVIAAFDGSRGGTFHTVNYALSRKRSVITIDPKAL